MLQFDIVEFLRSLRVPFIVRNEEQCSYLTVCVPKEYVPMVAAILALRMPANYVTDVKPLDN